jgi:hypothetical protein
MMKLQLSVMQWLRQHEFFFLTEFLLAWTLILAFSIFYVVDYILSMLEISVLRLKDDSSRWCHKIPITPLPQTKKRYSVSTSSRLEQLVAILKEKTTRTTEEESGSWSDDEVVEIIRGDCLARNLASLIMAESSCDTTTTTTTTSTQAANGTSATFSHHPLVRQMKRLWPRLLQFPNDKSAKVPQYEISLIVPAYKEKTADIKYTLKTATNNCDDPEKVQVVVVDAGGCCGDLSGELLGEKTRWGSLEVYTYNAGGGRGGTLNFGASKGKGEVFTFLHSDTLLPKHWDTMVKSAFTRNDVDTTRVSVCAFSMGVDLSSRGLKGNRYPPGLFGADRLLGYLRCNLCSLPYGDSALSFPSSVFRYLGGYPDQPLMEDYEIITLLRKRARLLDEKVAVLPARIQCSPRRWQAYGVCYTILINALCIRRYKSGATTEDLFELYYIQPTKKTS